MRVSWGDRPSADAWYLLVGPARMQMFAILYHRKAPVHLKCETAESARGCPRVNLPSRSVICESCSCCAWSVVRKLRLARMAADVNVLA